jgi:hypothetical protein
MMTRWTRYRNFYAGAQRLKHVEDSFVIGVTTHGTGTAGLGAPSVEEMLWHLRR